MKSKIIILTILSIFIFSCKSDDEGSETPPIPENEKLLDKINSNVGQLNFVYNPDKTVESLSVASAWIYSFNYSENRIGSIEEIMGGQTTTYTFEYDANGKIISFADADEMTPVVYYPATNSYSYEKGNGAANYEISLTENGDVKSLSYVDNFNAENDTNYTILYDNSKKGTMTNSNSITAHLLMATSDFDNLVFYLPISKKPIKTLSFSLGNVNTENTFDDQDFVLSTRLTAEGTVTSYEFSYTQLN